MANELRLNATIQYDDGTTRDSIQIADYLVTLATLKFIRHRQTITTSEVAIDLGGLATLGWGFFVNRDLTNYIELRVASGSAKFAVLRPGRFAFFEWGSDIATPYAIANTASCIMDYFLCPD